MVKILIPIMTFHKRTAVAVIKVKLMAIKQSLQSAIKVQSILTEKLANAVELSLIFSLLQNNSCISKIVR